MSENIISQYVQIQGSQIHYLSAGNLTEKTILFLHGASFNARTWEEIGSLQLFSQVGYGVVAVDLPSYGKSASIAGSPVEFLQELLTKLQLNQPIIVSPSMSGGYSLPFIARSWQQLAGFVAVAPVGITRTVKQLQGIPLPTLAIWGSGDRIVPIAHADMLVETMPQAQKVVLQNAGHACYMKATDKFHEHLQQFFDRTFAAIK